MAPAVCPTFYVRRPARRRVGVRAVQRGASDAPRVLFIFPPPSTTSQAAGSRHNPQAGRRQAVKGRVKQRAGNGGGG